MKKVAIVGVEGSGKTVMLAGLGDLYSHPDEKGCFLAPKNFSTASYVADKIARMRRGEWPTATAGDEMQGLDWTLKRREPGVRKPAEKVCEVSFLDFAGEVYRAAYGISSGGNASLREQAEELKQYVCGADELIVLINLRDVITNGLRDTRVQEAMWITKSILDTALGGDAGTDAPRAAIVLSQADSYASTIEACGGAQGVLEKYLPHVAAEYGWLDVFATNAVDKTDLNEDGNIVPAADFTTKGLLPIMKWIRGEVVSDDSGCGATALPGSELTGGARLLRLDDSQSCRARSPSGPQGDENACVEDIGRVDVKAHDGGEGKGSRKKVVVWMAVAFLAVCACGMWWWNGKPTRKAEKTKAEWEERERKGADVADNGHTKVQLWEGGPYWADTNIGAEKPWESGYYFWWGDTVGYKRQGDAWVASDGSKSGVSFRGKNTPTYKKSIAELLCEGWITSDNVLVPEHDAAHMLWGGNWRMPTEHELDDLARKCHWTWTTMNGVDGYVVRGNGAYVSASIFLPAAGYGYGSSLVYAGSCGVYWSSVPRSGYDYSWGLYFSSGTYRTYDYYRYYGRPVRPVQGSTK